MAHTLHQPIHPSVVDQLDPEYVAFHNQHVAHLVPPHTLPWNPEIRNGPAVPGGAEPVPVGSVQDFDLPRCKIRAYTPFGDAPAGGWPVFLYFHGGGWTLGNIASESSFCTTMCIGASCVVLSVDYRLAPEHPYPAAVEDAIDALVWTTGSAAASLSLNIQKLALGGSSSGANLAAILAIKAKQLSPSPVSPIFQLLIVPVIDNEATTNDRWKERQHTAWLSPDRMLWFRRNYLPDENDWRKWDASPIYAPVDLLKDLPKAWIALAEMDILCNEGEAYGQKLREAGVQVHIEVYKGAPHPLMSMAGVLSIGRKLVADSASQLKQVFA